MMKRIRLFFLMALVIVASLPCARAQDRPSEAGLPYVAEHYPPLAYGQHPQNWDVVQDSRGLVYVANNNGVLVFDGVRWRRIPTSTETDVPFVRSLDVNTGDTVYVGTKSDLGYLSPDSLGQLRFVSLKEEVPSKSRGFEEVWGTHVTPEGVYFQTRRWLFRWDGRKMKVWKGSAKGIHTSFEVRGRVYMRDIEYGLVTVAGDSLRLLPGGARFADVSVRVMMPYGKDRVLIGTQEGDFFLYDGTSMEPFPTQVSDFVQGTWLYHGCVLPGGYFALATLGRGVVIIDREGRVVQVLDQSAELPDGVVNYVYAGRQGMLWMALNNVGIAYAQLPSPLTVYGSETGLNGVIYAIQRYQGTLYVGTGAGLYRLDREPVSAEARQKQRRSTFTSVPNVPLTVRSLLSTEYGLLAATDFGIYRVEDGRAVQLTKKKAFTLLLTQHYGGVILAGTQTGLAVLEPGSDESGWRLRSVPGIDVEVTSLFEAPDGSFWMDTPSGTALRVRFPGGVGAPPQVERYDERDGLPGGSFYIGGLFNEMVVVSRQGIFRLAHRGGGTSAPHFVRDTAFSLSSTSPYTLQTYARANSTVWMSYDRWVTRLRRQPDGSYARFRPAALYFPKVGAVRLYAEENGVLWIGSRNELIRYDPAVSGIYDVHFPVLIREISRVGQDEEAVFGGTRRPGRAEGPRRVEYSLNDLRFSFSMPGYSTVTPSEYQYRLEGADGEWSAWRRTTRVTYTNLHEGTYRFMVRGRNERGYVSEVATFRFQVLPPWYRTWWAYTFYVVAVVLSVLGYRHYRRILNESRRAREQAAALARERTANRRLEQANEELEHFNMLKDTFLANTSHELRTPLTAILGFAEVIKEESVSEKHQEFLDIIEENGYRLLDTLNALLDVAKIRAGLQEVDLERVDVCAKARKVSRLLHALADAKGLALETDLPQEPVFALLHPGYFERVLQNLAGNAIKFTEEGHVTLSVRTPGDRVEVHVRDTGIGIDEAFLPDLFKEFKQESTGMTRSYEGNGLGLAITARLVDLMRGSIEVESVKGKGSHFVISFARDEEIPEQTDRLVTFEA